MLCDRHESRRATPVQVLQQLVDMQNQGVFLRHGGLIAVEAVDHDGFDLLIIDRAAHAMRKLARREFGSIDLFDKQPTVAACTLEVDTHCLHAIEQQT